MPTLNAAYPATEMGRIKRLIEHVYNGAAWHGPTIQEALQGITAEQAFTRFRDVHTIAELVGHMTAWRTFTMKRLEGEMGYELSEADNWPELTQQDETQWYYIKNKLDVGQERLVERLDDMLDGDELLAQQVHNKGYDYYTLLHGVAEHDIYHVGQIMVIKKCLV